MTDCLLLAQTIIMFLTGLVIFWYTWETQQLRKVSSRQAELLQEQLAMMRQTLQMDVQEQLRASKPFVRWRGGSSGGSTWTREFQNEGAPISHLSIHTDAPIDATLRPTDLIQTNQMGNVSFQARTGQSLPNPINFEIRYRTRLDQSETKRFIVEGGTPREIEPAA